MYKKPRNKNRRPVMARKKGTKVKKAVEKLLDKTTVDEKVIAHVNENRSLYNKILSS